MTISETTAPSPSMEQPDYWWYRARAGLLRTVLDPWFDNPGLVLDVGSADGPSVDWMQGRGHRVPLDVDFSSLRPGGVCASALELPFADESFDIVAAFDVLEHCSPESKAVSELIRVLRPGGRIFLSVPAYQWAWTTFDVEVGHHRRYTRRRLRESFAPTGVRIERLTHLFAGTFPMFAAERIVRKVRKPVDDADTLPAVAPSIEKVLMGLSRADERLLARGRDLPFGSSIVLVATKPA